MRPWTIVKKAVEIDPIRRFTYNLGNALLRMGQLDGAMFNSERLWNSDPITRRAHNNSASLFSERATGRKVMIQFQEALSSTRLREAHYNLGAVFGVRDGWMKPSNSTRKAIQLKPDYADARGIWPCVAPRQFG